MMLASEVLSFLFLSRFEVSAFPMNRKGTNGLQVYRAAAIQDSLDGTRLLLLTEVNWEPNRET